MRMFWKIIIQIVYELQFYDEIIDSMLTTSNNGYFWQGGLSYLTKERRIEETLLKATLCCQMSRKRQGPYHPGIKNEINLICNGW